MSEQGPHIAPPVTVEDELARISEMGGVSADELAGMNPISNEFEQSRAFDNEETAPAIVNEESHLEQQPAPVSVVVKPTPEQLQQGVDLLKKVQLNSWKYTEILSDLEALESPAVAIMLAKEVVFKLQPTLAEIDGDYISAYVGISVEVNKLSIPEVRRQTEQAICNAQRNSICDGVNLENTSHPSSISLDKAEVLSYIIKDDQIRENLIIDLMDSSRVSVTDAAIELLGHLGKYYDPDLIFNAWIGTRDLDRPLTEEERDDCRKVSSLPPTAGPPVSVYDISSALAVIDATKASQTAMAIELLGRLDDTPPAAVALRQVTLLISEVVRNTAKRLAQYGEISAAIKIMNNPVWQAKLSESFENFRVNSLAKDYASRRVSPGEFELLSYTIEDDCLRETLIADYLTKLTSKEEMIRVVSTHLGNYYDRDKVLELLNVLQPGEGLFGRLNNDLLVEGLGDE